MAVLIILFILAYIGFTIYMFYNMLANGSLGLFVFSLISYILLWYLIAKNTRNNEKKVWEKSTDFEVTYEEQSIEHPLYEENSDTDDSFIYKEECLTDDSMDFDVYLDAAVGKQAEWQKAFFGDYDKSRK